MTTNDERSPSLSGANTDDLTGREPMIKGEVEKAQADMRGAYLAGNLDGLLSLMDDQQQLAFKQWNVRLALRKIKPVIHYYEEACAAEDLPQRQVAAAEVWLQSPDEANRRQAHALTGRGWREEDPCAWLPPKAANASQAAWDLMLYMGKDDHRRLRSAVLQVFRIHEPAWAVMADDHRKLMERVREHMQHLRRSEHMMLCAQLRAAFIILGGNPFAVAGERK